MQGETNFCIIFHTMLHPDRRFESIRAIPLPRLEDLSGTYDYPDPYIGDLVRTLSGLGFRTVESCEGHLDKIRHPFPWVTLRELNGSARSLEIEVDQFNRTSEVKWTASGKVQGLQSETGASSREELFLLQQGAVMLADFLFERYLRRD